MRAQVRRNTAQQVGKHEQGVEMDAATAAQVLGRVSKGECQMINRVLLSSTSIHGNLDAVPHACTVAEEGNIPDNHRGSWMLGFLARRATKLDHAVEWPEGTIPTHPEEHVKGGDITRGECAALAKHLATTFGTLGLLPGACKTYDQM
mmetsp:Transcript_4356/g.11158  ORF Transcript_4356/g.11158 Transcript_4356/m.11158 type:complete len:148 (+) Transcript_4356:245-688(+)